MTDIQHNKQTIILIHGFHSDSSAMGSIFRFLKKDFNPILAEVPLSFQDPLIIVDQIKKQIKELIKAGNDTLSFVGHSTGGIIIRMLMNDQNIARHTRHCIFIGVPNKGTVLAELHGKLPELIRDIHLPVKYLTPKAIRELNLIKPVHVAYAGIAGNKGLDYTRSLFDTANDGVVAVDSVYMDEMKDFVQLPYNHFELTDHLITCLLIKQFITQQVFFSELKGNMMTLAEKFEYIVSEGHIDDLCRYSALNIPAATAGGKVWWNLLAQKNGWKLQQNKLTQHIRILNPEDIRKAWGQENVILDAIEKTFSRIKIDEICAKG